MPKFAHLPLIFNPDGSKMSKRDKDKAVRAAVKAAGDVTASDAGVDERDFAKWQKDKSVQLPQDKLVPLAAKLGVETGDWIEIGHIGAYSLSLRTRFNGFYPDKFVEVTTPFDEGGAPELVIIDEQKVLHVRFN